MSSTLNQPFTVSGDAAFSGKTDLNGILTGSSVDCQTLASNAIVSSTGPATVELFTFVTPNITGATTISSLVTVSIQWYFNSTGPKTATFVLEDPSTKTIFVSQGFQQWFNPSWVNRHVNHVIYLVADLPVNTTVFCKCTIPSSGNIDTNDRLHAMVSYRGIS
jgi:hypothetical protein